MKELPISNLEQHLRDVHEVHVFPSPERQTPAGLAERAAVYVANEQTHARVHGGHHLQKPAGAPRHVHNRFV